MIVIDDVAQVIPPRSVASYKRALLRDPCSYCGAPVRFLDHIVAKARGGGEAWWNLAPACDRCNTSKGSRSLLSFLGARAHRPAWDAITRQRSLWSRVGAR